MKFEEDRRQGSLESLPEVFGDDETMSITDTYLQSNGYARSITVTHDCDPGCCVICYQSESAPNGWRWLIVEHGALPKRYQFKDNPGEAIAELPEYWTTFCPTCSPQYRHEIEQVIEEGEMEHELTSVVDAKPEDFSDDERDEDDASIALWDRVFGTFCTARNGEGHSLDVQIEDDGSVVLYDAYDCVFDPSRLTDMRLIYRVEWWPGKTDDEGGPVEPLHVEQIRQALSAYGVSVFTCDDKTA